MNDTNSSAGIDTVGSLRDFIVDDSSDVDSVDIPGLQTSVSDGSSSVNEESPSETERQRRRHSQESSPANRTVRSDRAINCTKALLEAIERMNPEEVNIEVSIHITGTTGQDVQHPSSMRTQRCDCLICGVEKLHIAVPHQCKCSFSTQPAESKLEMDKTNHSASNLSKSAIY